MNMKYVLSVTANPALDKVLNVRGFKRGIEQKGSPVFLSAGGKGLNVCRGLNSMRVACLATGFVGGLTGEYIQERLRQEGILFNFMDIPQETRTNLTLVDSQNHKITRILEPGPRITSAHVNAFLRKFRHLCSNAVMVIISGSMIPGAGTDFYRKIISVAHRLGKDVILDSSHKALVDGIKEKPFMITPNENEAKFVLNMSLSSRNYKRKALENFLRRGVRNVCITLGAKGAIASNGKYFLVAKIPFKIERHTVGCGDAFVAGFVYAYLRQKDFKECVRYAVAAGTASMLHQNPGSLQMSQVTRMVKRVRLYPLS